MANIPVEKTGGAGIWPWLIGILALVLVGWLVLELFDEEPDADEIAGTENNVGIIDDVELELPTLTAESELYEDYGTGAYADAEVDVDEPAVVGVDVDGDGMIEEAGMAADGTRRGDSRVGRSVDLNGASVLSVVGDSAFFVGSDEQRRVLVVLESLGEAELGAGGSDGRFNVDEGQTLNLSGTVARYVEGARGTWDLPESERERMLQRGLYVRVNSPSDLSMME